MEHEKSVTIKVLRKDLFRLLTIGVISAVFSCMLFFLGIIGYGLISFAVCAISLFFSCMTCIKLHARYTQEIILDLTNSKRENFCLCEECSSKREEHA